MRFDEREGIILGELGMSLIILKIMLVLGIIGHVLNMYCDRILSIFPNGMLKMEDLQDIGNEGKMVKLMEEVSENIPMRSAILGAFALMLEFLRYFPITAYIYEYSKWIGSSLFIAIVLFITIGVAHHVKYDLVEWVFLKLGRDDKAKSLMVDLYNSVPITKICYIGYLVFIITLIFAIASGVTALPIWAVIFTILPIFLVLASFRIIGTLHISDIFSRLAWIILI